MRATRFNHVSVHARNLEHSMRFYVNVFGMERLPTYSFDHSLLPELKRLADSVPQTGDARRATLYLEKAAL